MYATLGFGGKVALPRTSGSLRLPPRGRYAIAMRIILLLPLLLALPAHAITPSAIAKAAVHAHNGLRTVVSKLASKKVAGRDNGTPGSLIAQTYLIRQLRRLGRGLNGGGRADAAYKQAFTHLG